MADLLCSVPMLGMVESFNISVATAVVLHHVTRDRTARKVCTPSPCSHVFLPFECVAFPFLCSSNNLEARAAVYCHSCSRAISAIRYGTQRSAPPFFAGLEQIGCAVWLPLGGAGPPATLNLEL